VDERKWRYGKVELENIWKKCILEIKRRILKEKEMECDGE